MTGTIIYSHFQLANFGIISFFLLAKAQDCHFCQIGRHLKANKHQNWQSRFEQLANFIESNGLWDPIDIEGKFHKSNSELSTMKNKLCAAKTVFAEHSLAIDTKLIQMSLGQHLPPVILSLIELFFANIVCLLVSIAENVLLSLHTMVIFSKSSMSQEDLCIFVAHLSCHKQDHFNQVMPKHLPSCSIWLNYCKSILW